MLQHGKHMKLVKPFTPHVIAWSVRKGLNQSICRTKEQKTRLQCLASVMTKCVMPSAQQLKSAVSEEKKRKDLAVSTESLFPAELSSSNVNQNT